jgi:glycosyltransferase involved in cell wall biosynthesis
MGCGGKMIRRGLNYISDYAKNLVTDARLNYIVESRDWSIKQDGKDITSHLKNTGLTSRITTTSKGLKGKIIHFGSINTYSKPHPSNKSVLTWFHIVKDDKNLENIREIGKNIEILHTTNQITKQAFIDMGADEDKIITIPLGVDLKLFHPLPEIEGYWELRHKFGIPPDVKVIGTFQKDGNGWGAGNDPKWVKDPQTFIEVVKKLNDQYNGKIFVLLLGVARGYVKTMLSLYGIKFKHIYLNDFKDVAKYYRVLDLYLVTSRSEGMPKAILESMASGIPIISTSVGIAPEVIRNGFNGFIVDVGDSSSMVNYATYVLANESVARTLREGGIETASKYSWDRISRRFYDEIYSKLV